jgi:hypothetical protein
MGARDDASRLFRRVRATISQCRARAPPPLRAERAAYFCRRRHYIGDRSRAAHRVPLLWRRCRKADSALHGISPGQPMMNLGGRNVVGIAGLAVLIAITAPSASAQLSDAPLPPPRDREAIPGVDVTYGDAVVTNGERVRLIVTIVLRRACRNKRARDRARETNAPLDGRPRKEPQARCQNGRRPRRSIGLPRVPIPFWQSQCIRADGTQTCS